MPPTARIDDILSDARLLVAWVKVKENQGAPGVDGQPISAFEKRLMANLARLREEVLNGAYRPAPLRRVHIPKKDGGLRPLSIPTVRDRVLQTAVADALTPLFEAEFEEVSFGYRRRRSVEQAVTRVAILRNQGYRWVVDADIEDFFGQVDHELLMNRVRQLVMDETILALIDCWLKTEVQEGGRRIRPVKGIPQGSPVSPLLANLYLDTLDDVLLDAGKRLVRYADDFLVLCKTRRGAEQALELTESVLSGLKLELDAGKTRVVDFEQGFRFLGIQFIRSLAFRPEAEGKPPPPCRAETTDAVHPPSPPERPPDETMPHPADFTPSTKDAAHPPHADYRLDPRLRTLYLLKHGLVLGKASARLTIHWKGRLLEEVPAVHVDQIMIFGNAQISTQAMRFCLAERIPVYLLSASGRYYGVVDSFDTEPVLLHKAQFEKAEDPEFCLRLARSLIRGKITNSRALLKRLSRKRPAEALEKAAAALKTCLPQLAGSVSLDQLRGVEGNAARIYFSAFREQLDPDWRFTGRNRQPPRDPVNALLSYGYTLLFYNLYSLIRARGLNPQVGYLHPLRMGHPALVSDLLEEFRALVVDAIVWNLVLNRRLSPDDFTPPDEDSGGCRMNDRSRKMLVHEMEKKLNTPLTHPLTGHRLDYRRCMEHQINQLAAVLRGKQSEYRPMTVR